MVLEQLFTIAIVVYVAWMLAVGRTVWFCRLDHPGRVRFLNYRWVHRNEETGLYWAVIAYHFIIIGVLTYVAFIRDAA